MPNESTPSDCPFCRSNQLLRGTVLAENQGAYLMENVQFPGNYLIIPDAHVESPLDLNDTWWADVKALLPKLPLPLTDYNLSFNIGTQAGQTIKHLHLWVIPRKPDEQASGKGLITLINYHNEYEK